MTMTLMSVLVKKSGLNRYDLSNHGYQTSASRHHLHLFYWWQARFSETLTWKYDKKFCKLKKAMPLGNAANFAPQKMTPPAPLGHDQAKAR